MKKLIIMFISIVIIFTGCNNKEIEALNTENASNIHDVVMCTEEAKILFSKIEGFDINELTCNISNDQKGLFELSWANPGGGTGGVWFIDPFTGDVYSFDNNKLYNIYERLNTN